MTGMTILEKGWFLLVDVLKLFGEDDIPKLVENAEAP